jgi:hypothetical protein
MNRIVKLSCVFIMMLCAGEVAAVDRYFTWINPKTNLRTRISLDKFELLNESENSVWINEGKINLDTTIFNHLPPEINNSYFVYDKGNRIRISLVGTGQVYDYFPEEKKLIRVDKTFHSGYNFGMNMFMRKGLIYGIGGEGFWNYSPNISYFDENKKEWEIHRPKNKGPLAILGGYQGYNSKLDVFYAGGSEYVQYLEEEKRDYIEDLYRFDFKQNSWEQLGKLNADLPFKKSDEVIWSGDLFFHFADWKIYIIDPVKNEVYLYKDNTKPFRRGVIYEVKKDTITSFLNLNNGPIVKLSISEIQKKSVYFGKFYRTGIAWYWYGLGLPIMIILGLLYFRKKKNNLKISLLSFTDLEKKLLFKLLELQPEAYLTTHDINDILGTRDKSQENQRRVRFNVINEANNKIYLKLKHKDAIERTSLAEDKRLTLYKLNQEILNEVRSLLE